jgi:leucyl aminopeptidase
MLLADGHRLTDAAAVDCLYQAFPTLSIESRDQAWAESMGMGSFLSVARGSHQPPRFLEMRYSGGPKLSGIQVLF